MARPIRSFKVGKEKTYESFTVNRNRSLLQRHSLSTKMRFTHQHHTDFLSSKRKIFRLGHGSLWGFAPYARKTFIDQSPTSCRIGLELASVLYLRWQHQIDRICESHMVQATSILSSEVQQLLGKMPVNLITAPDEVVDDFVVHVRMYGTLISDNVYLEKKHVVDFFDSNYTRYRNAVLRKLKIEDGAVAETRGDSDTVKEPRTASSNNGRPSSSNDDVHSREPDSADGGFNPGVSGGSYVPLDILNGERVNSSNGTGQGQCKTGPSTSTNREDLTEDGEKVHSSKDSIKQQSHELASSSERSTCTLCLASYPLTKMHEVSSQKQRVLLISGLLMGKEISENLACRIYKECGSECSYFCRHHLVKAVNHIAKEVRNSTGKCLTHSLTVSRADGGDLLRRIRKVTSKIDTEVEVKIDDLIAFYRDCQADYQDEEIYKSTLDGSASKEVKNGCLTVTDTQQKSKNGLTWLSFPCLICGKRNSNMESCPVLKPVDQNLVLLSCLVSSQALTLQMAQMVFKEMCYKNKRICLKHHIQAGKWLFKSAEEILTQTPPRDFDKLPDQVKMSLLTRLREYATQIEENGNVTDEHLLRFYNDCQLRYHTESGWTNVDLWRYNRADAMAAYKAMIRLSSLAEKRPAEIESDPVPTKRADEEKNQESSSLLVSMLNSGRIEQQQTTLSGKCSLCGKADPFKRYRITPLRNTISNVLLSCLIMNGVTEAEKGKKLYRSWQKYGNLICHDHFHFVAEWLQKKWAGYGELTQVRLTHIRELLQDPLYIILVDVSKSVVGEEMKMTRCSFKAFFSEYNKFYQKYRKRLVKVYQDSKRELMQESKIEQEGAAPESMDISQNSAYTDEKMPGMDWNAMSFIPVESVENESSEDHSRSDSTYARVFPAHLFDSDSKPLSQASTSSEAENQNNIADEKMPEDPSFCTEFSAEDLLSGQTATGSREMCNADEQEPSTSTDQCSALTNGVLRDAAGQPTLPDVLSAPSAASGAHPLDRKEVQNRALFANGWGITNIVNIAPNDVLDHITSRLGIEAVASYLYPNHFMQRPPLNEAQLRSRLEMFYALSLRNQMAPFLPRILTFGVKRIYYDSHKRIPLHCTGELPGDSVLLTVWWSSAGVIYHAFMQDDPKTQKRRYLTPSLFLSQLGEVHRILRTRNMEMPLPIILCDEPQPYINQDVITKMLQRGMEVLPYPMNATDLLPSHYHFFPYFYKFIENRDYSYIYKLRNDLKDFIATRPPNFYVDGINELASRWNKCVEMKGTYVDL
ncbi:unnamed protein product [Cylicocyclus nassatus]|uniref:Lin-15A/B-like domain-containing protein n=1 Tax=Cylicocyclus nassatus TaxID=53992 RepID=A0AA36M2W3_CYLNA|nr:unnamed protein product [Cylicocyclus nassatus]